MNYTCTRDNSISISASKAILAGISPDGGLFLPEEFPKVSLDDISKMRSMTYPERAAYIICLFLTDFKTMSSKHIPQRHIPNHASARYRRL